MEAELKVWNQEMENGSNGIDTMTNNLKTNHSGSLQQSDIRDIFEVSLPGAWDSYICNSILRPANFISTWKVSSFFFIAQCSVTTNPSLQIC